MNDSIRDRTFTSSNKLFVLMKFTLTKFSCRYSLTIFFILIHFSKNYFYNAATPFRLDIKDNKKRRNATKPGFQRFNQVFMWQEKEMKDGSNEKMMSSFWLHWLHAPSLVSIGKSKLKLLSGNRISIFSNVQWPWPWSQTPG